MLGAGDGAVTAFATLEIEERFEQTGAIEIRPECIGDEDFGVSDLPEEEIADAHFTAGADEEIRIGKIGSVEVAGDVVLGDEARRFRAVAVSVRGISFRASVGRARFDCDG